MGRSQQAAIIIIIISTMDLLKRCGIEY
jgi:hypothetical protein